MAVASTPESREAVLETLRDGTRKLGEIARIEVAEAELEEGCGNPRCPVCGSPELVTEKATP